MGGAAARAARRAWNLHDEFRACALFRIHADAAAVRLHDLIHDRQTQPVPPTNPD